MRIYRYLYVSANAAVCHLWDGKKLTFHFALREAKKINKIKMLTLAGETTFVHARTNCE